MKIIPLSENRNGPTSRKLSLLSAQQNPIILDEHRHLRNDKRGDSCEIDIVSNPTVEHYNEITERINSDTVVEWRTNSPSHTQSNTVFEIDMDKETNNRSAAMGPENRIQRRSKSERDSSVETIL